MTKKIITIYFSRRGQNYVNGSIVNLKRGNTEVCAEYIQKAVGGDLFEIVPDREYSEDYMTCTEEAQAELRAKEQVPVKEYLDNLEDYDIIFLGYPNWWGSYPMAVDTFLKKSIKKLSGKTIIPFATHEGSRLGRSVSDLRKLLPNSIVKDGFAIHGADVYEGKAEEIVNKWLSGLEI